MPRQKHEALFGFRQLHDLQFDAMRLVDTSTVLDRVTLVHLGKAGAVARGVLHGFGKAANLVVAIHARLGHVQRQHLAQCVHGQVQLGATLAFGAVIAGVSVRLRGDAQRAAGQDGSARLGHTPVHQPQHGP